MSLFFIICVSRCHYPETQLIFDAIGAPQYLHSNDMIHCDIKPANLLIDGEDDTAVIKLANFGMTVTSDAKEIMGGTPVYMAPEHLLAWRRFMLRFNDDCDTEYR